MGYGGGMSIRKEVEAPDGTHLALERFDGEGPTVVLLHAGVADRRSWREVAALLNERGADACAYDRRGFGETPGTDDPFDHLEDLTAVLDEVAAGEPVWLVGNSQGGLIALDLALTSPERVAGLVLIAPAVSGAPEIADDDVDPATLEIGERIEEAEDEGDIDLVNELEVRLWLDGPSAPAGRVGGGTRELALRMNGVALIATGADDEGGGGRDAWSRVEEIEIPATVVWGDLDIPAIVDRCRELAGRLPNCDEPVILPGAAHLPGLERPRETADVIAEAIGI